MKCSIYIQIEINVCISVCVIVCMSVCYMCMHACLCVRICVSVPVQFTTLGKKKVSSSSSGIVQHDFANYYRPQEGKNPSSDKVKKPSIKSRRRAVTGRGGWLGHKTLGGGNTPFGAEKQVARE